MIKPLPKGAISGMGNALSSFIISQPRRLIERNIASHTLVGNSRYMSRSMEPIKELVETSLSSRSNNRCPFYLQVLHFPAH
jgi:hypothetical protein